MGTVGTLLDMELKTFGLLYDVYKGKLIVGTVLDMERKNCEIRKICGFLRKLELAM